MAQTDPIPRYTLYCLPWKISISPGLSVTPAHRHTNITTCEPPASTVTITQEYLIPRSTMTGTPYSLAAVAQSSTAVICGTPIPATPRVVQIDPGPIPTFTIVAPASIKSLVASAVATFPATMS